MISKNEGENLDDETGIIYIVLGIPLGIIIILVFILMIFHLYINIRGKTTRELLKKKNI